MFGITDITNLLQRLFPTAGLSVGSPVAASHLLDPSIADGPVANDLILKATDPSRRTFLKYLGIGTATALVGSTIDVEKLLWTPGERIIVAPLIEPVAMGNQFITMQMVTEYALKVLKNNLEVSMFNRDYDGEFGRRDFKIGDTVRIRKPARYVPAYGGFSI